MFNLTNVGLSICVTEYSDLFLNLTIEHAPILAFMSVQGNYLVWREKFVIVPTWQEKFEQIPAWRGKVGIVLMLINPAWRESFGIVLILYGGRKM
jgi:hypothetical protein